MLATASSWGSSTLLSRSRTVVHTDYDEAARLLADGLHAALSEVAELRSGERIRSRRAKFLEMGVYTG